jgi:hypothetical protein
MVVIDGSGNKKIVRAFYHGTNPNLSLVIFYDDSKYLHDEIRFSKFELDKLISELVDCRAEIESLENRVI